MKRQIAARRQHGYLYELPLILLVSIMLAGISYPYLAPPWNHMALGLPAAAFVIYLLYSWYRRR